MACFTHPAGAASAGPEGKLHQRIETMQFHQQQESKMRWITFQTEAGGLLKVQAQHVVAIYDELGHVKLSTAAGGVHTLAPGTSVQKAASQFGEASGVENSQALLAPDD